MHEEIHDHDHDHDLGLAHDRPRLLSRRRALQLLGVVGAATAIGCGGGDDGGTTSDAGTGTTGATPSGADGGTTTAIPEETAGPFPGDGTNGPDVLADDAVVRRDITSSFGSSTTVAEGIPTTVTLSLTDTANGGAALAGAAVYVWHCDREGRYSMYSEGVEDENYLRGVQESDADGQVTFRTIFPACYPGRWPHIHFEVYESVDAALRGGTRFATSQLAIPEDACDEAFAADGYEGSVGSLAQLSLATDGVFRDGYELQLAAVAGSVDEGYTFTLSVPVDATATSSGSAGFGGPPPN